MTKRQRDYSNLKESERVFDAVKMNSTHIKDYSMSHICGSAWRLNDEMGYQRLVHVYIGDQTWVGRADVIAQQVNKMADDADDDNWFPRHLLVIHGRKNTLVIDTRGISEECLQDHIARVSIGDKTAIMDLEELLKATRYA